MISRCARKLKKKIQRFWICVTSRGDNKTFVLFTKNSDPSLCRPTGKKVEILKFDNNTEKISLTLLKKINEII